MHNTARKLLKRPPLISKGRIPGQILSPRDQDRLARLCKYFSDKQKDTSKNADKCQFNEGERKELASIFEMMRDQYGFYPGQLGADGLIVWGQGLKSDVQMLAEKEADRYEKIGKELIESDGIKNILRRIEGE